MSGIYIASKTVHAPKWKALRAQGVPIISTWIDEAGVGETASFADLWTRCVSEASRASALVVYAEPGEVLKGGLVEVGAALASGNPVFAVGKQSGWSFTSHTLVTECESIEHAIDLAMRRVGGDWYFVEGVRYCARCCTRRCERQVGGTLPCPDEKESP